MENKPKVSLEKIKLALIQPNNAIRKRALAIIFNDAIIEAKDILEEYIGRETEPDLQAFALKVLQKLQDFRDISSQVANERLFPLLQSSDLESKLLALRGLATRHSPEIPLQILSNCSLETSPEAVALICQILKNNPSPQNLPLLLKYTQDPSDKVRMDALEGILNVMYGCLFPYVLKALLDPSPPMKMKAYQLISEISRTNLLSALGFMLESSSLEISRLAAKLFPSFLDADLMPLLQKHIQHSDAETAASCKRALQLLTQKGNSSALELLATLSKTGATFPPSSTKRKPIPPQFESYVSNFPQYISEIILEGISPENPPQMFSRLHEVFLRVRHLLVSSFTCLYFSQANRNPFLDRICYKALQIGMSRIDAIGFLRTIAPALNDSSSPGELFPMVISYRLQNDFNDNLLETLTILKDNFLAVDEHPEEGIAFTDATLTGIEELFKCISPLTENKLVVKCTDKRGVKIMDFMKPTPTTIDARLLVNFELPLNSPVLVSKNSALALPLFPFLTYEADKREITKCDPSENELWEFLMKYKVLDGFLGFLKERKSE